MLSRFARFAAPCAAFALSACAGGGDALRRDVDGLRTELAALRQQNDALSRRLDVLGRRVEGMADRDRATAPAARAAAEPSGPIVPPDLAVVRVAPPPERAAVRVLPARAPRSAPAIPTAVPIAEPDPERLDDLSQPSGREIAAEAESELVAARRKSGVDRAHALEAFVARYPRHPSADNALVEGAQDYAEAGREDAGCALARRVPEDYPAGDAVSDALKLVARCERTRP